MCEGIIQNVLGVRVRVGSQGACPASARRPLWHLPVCACAFSECVSVCLHASYKCGLDVRVLCVCVYANVLYKHASANVLYEHVSGGVVCVCANVL